MENKEVNNTAQSAFTIAVLFGMWLQQKEQRKRLAKTQMADLFTEWINEIQKKYED
jgi:hypothetical protein